MYYQDEVVFFYENNYLTNEQIVSPYQSNYLVRGKDASDTTTKTITSAQKYTLINPDNPSSKDAIHTQSNFYLKNVNTDAYMAIKYKENRNGFEGVFSVKEAEANSNDRLDRRLSAVIGVKEDNITTDTVNLDDLRNGKIDKWNLEFLNTERSKTNELLSANYNKYKNEPALNNMLRLNTSTGKLNITDALLSDITFKAVNINRCHFTSCDFTNDNFEASNIEQVTFDDCDFSDVNFNPTVKVVALTVLSNVTFNNCDFRKTLFYGSDGTYLEIKNSEFNNDNMTELTVGNGFHWVDLANSNFDNVKIKAKGNEFEECNLRNVTFQNCDLRGVRFVKCTFNDQSKFKNCTFDEETKFQYNNYFNPESSIDGGGNTGDKLIVIKN